LQFLQGNSSDGDNNSGYSEETVTSEIMIPFDKVHTIEPDASITDAIQLMQQHKVGCLPVVKGKKLVGILTEKHFVSISARLLKMQLNS
jgi:CBS domain-containing protein